MMKKVLTALAGAIPILMMAAFAMPVDLDLLGGGLSVLDSLFLIGAGLALLGILFLCIAFLKPEKPAAAEEEQALFPEELPANEAIEAEDASEEEPENLDEDAQEEEPETIEESEEAEEAPEEVVEETAEEAEEPVEEAPEQEKEAEAEEKAYPTLTLTGINNGDFKILPLKATVTLGRRPDNDLVFSDTTISGLHCEITVEEDKVYLCDKGSTNGTFVNATRVFEKTELQKGDILALGQMEFRVGI